MTPEASAAHREPLTVAAMNVCDAANDVLSKGADDFTLARLEAATDTLGAILDAEREAAHRDSPPEPYHFPDCDCGPDETCPNPAAQPIASRDGEIAAIAAALLTMESWAQSPDDTVDPGDFMSGVPTVRAYAAALYDAGLRGTPAATPEQPPSLDALQGVYYAALSVIENNYRPGPDLPYDDRRWSGLVTAVNVAHEQMPARLAAPSDPHARPEPWEVAASIEYGNDHSDDPPAARLASQPDRAESGE